MIERIPDLTPSLDAAFTADGTSLVSKEKAFETEIGDVKQPDFKPQIKIKRFGNAANLSVRYLSDEPADVSLDGPYVVYRTPTRTLRFSNEGGFEEGGQFKIDADFPQRPADPVLTFSLETKRLEIFEQPPLAYEAADGSTWEPNPWGQTRSRPAHVNGSYAIYAKGLGKLCHIFRPWIEDATGQRVWCPLTIDEATNRLTVTIPDDFYRTAALPWHLDPTFGYTSTGASDDNIDNVSILCKATTTPASNGTLDSVTITGRIKTDDAGVHPDHAPAIYSDVVGVPTAKLAGLDTAGTSYGVSDGAVLTNLTYASLTSGVQYWLGTRQNNSRASFGVTDAFFKFDTNGGATELYFRTGSGGGAWEATTAGYSSATNERVSIYGTFTGSGVSISPGAGALTMTGLAVSLAFAFNLAIPAGAVAFTGLAPSVSVSSANSIAVPAGSVAFSSTAPQSIIDHPIAIPAGSLGLAGQFVTIAFGGELTAGQLTFTGYAPTIVLGGALSIAIPAGTETFTGYPALVNGGLSIAVAAGAVTVTSSAPTIDWGTGVLVGSLAFSSTAPQSSLGFKMDIPAGSLVFQGYAPDLDAPHSIAIPAGSLVWTGRVLSPLNGGRLAQGDLTTQVAIWMRTLTTVGTRNIVIRDAIQTLYGTTEPDVTPLFARFTRDRN